MKKSKLHKANVSGNKKSVKLTDRQLKITCTLIEMAKANLHEFNLNCAKFFGWSSNPKETIQLYIDEVTEIQKILLYKKDASLRKRHKSK